jgi:hypothetical protein
MTVFYAQNERINFFNKDFCDRNQRIVIVDNCSNNLYTHKDKPIYSLTMLRFATLALFATTVSASAVPSLTPENYDKLTEGKTVFLKFFAPWVRQ